MNISNSRRMDDSPDRLSTMRLYGSSIAVVSGAYSLYLATTGPAMATTDWGMLLLGVVVLLHGVILLTPLAARLGRASGPLMIGYAALMLLVQAWMATMNPMGDGMNDGMESGAAMEPGAAMGADPGMVAIALLMLASGVIMTARRGMLD